jgi:hypothetical protein
MFISTSVPQAKPLTPSGLRHFGWSFALSGIATLHCLRPFGHPWNSTISYYIKQAPSLPCLGHQAMTPLCFHNPGCNICARMAWVIVATHCCTTTGLHHISATMTYAMWREEHLWAVSVLQRVHHSNLVKINPSKFECTLHSGACQIRGNSLFSSYYETSHQVVSVFLNHKFKESLI